MSFLAVASVLMPALSGMLDKLIPDPEQKAQAQLELLRLQQEGAFRELDAELQLNLAQAKVNEIEAASTSAFASGWRPAAGWVCVLGLLYAGLLRPLLPWVLAVCGVPDVPALPPIEDVLTELIFGMLGLGAMRSADRWKRVSAISKA